MKKILTLTLAISMAVFFAASCSKEKEDTNSLVGTTWTYYYSADEGSTIRFVTESVAYISDWEYEHGEYVEEDGDQVNYVYNAPNGVLYKSGRAINFTIEGNQLTIIMEDEYFGQEITIFIKQ